HPRRRGIRLLPPRAARPPGHGPRRASRQRRARRDPRGRRGGLIYPMEDIASFLGSHPPFDGVGADERARVAAVTEIETFPRGKTIFSEGTGPVEYLRVVRAGSVEILHEGQVLDLLGPGELFGHASMLSGLPTGFEARAAEETLCYRIPADVIGALLARPDFLRFIARSILSGRAAAAPER